MTYGVSTASLQPSSPNSFPRNRSAWLLITQRRLLTSAGQYTPPSVSVSPGVGATSRFSISYRICSIQYILLWDAKTRPFCRCPHRRGVEALQALQHQALTHKPKIGVLLRVHFSTPYFLCFAHPCGVPATRVTSLVLDILDSGGPFPISPFPISHAQSHACRDSPSHSHSRFQHTSSTSSPSPEPFPGVDQSQASLLSSSVLIAYYLYLAHSSTFSLSFLLWRPPSIDSRHHDHVSALGRILYEHKNTPHKQARESGTLIDLPISTEHLYFRIVLRTQQHPSSDPHFRRIDHAAVAFGSSKSHHPHACAPFPYRARIILILSFHSFFEMAFRFPLIFLPSLLVHLAHHPMLVAASYAEEWTAVDMGFVVGTVGQASRSICLQAFASRQYANTVGLEPVSRTSALGTQEPVRPPITTLIILSSHSSSALVYYPLDLLSDYGSCTYPSIFITISTSDDIIRRIRTSICSSTARSRLSPWYLKLPKILNTEPTAQLLGHITLNMAVVLNSEESSYFSSTPLRRSHSQPKFSTRQSTFGSPVSTSRKDGGYSIPKIADSAPSSAPSSPRIMQVESEDSSFASTPASNLSSVSDCDDAVEYLEHAPEDNFVLPHYPMSGFYDTAEDLESPLSPPTGDSQIPSPAGQDTSGNTSRPGSPEFVLEVDRAEDDTAVKAQPTRHVDYLSYNWAEEDIWSSWRYVVSRRSEYSNSARLENASWRTWMKSKNNLKTVSPETLNWLKDCDVTWLYGPLQKGHGALLPPNAKNGDDDTLNGLTQNHSFINKKPILKKRSMSEIMLQRSLSASSLVKTAAAAVQAQEKDGERRLLRPSLKRAATDFGASPFSYRGLSYDSSSAAPSSSSSGVESPSCERKHIHFNEQVEQCIAVEARGEDEDDDDGDDDDADTERCDDSDSADEGIMMKRSKPRKRMPVLRRRTKKSKKPSEKKIIAMLPSTTLKYREDATESTETAMKHGTAIYQDSVLSPSSSQETLRPSKGMGKFFIQDEDEDAMEDMLTPRGERYPATSDDKDPELRGTPSIDGPSSSHEPAGMRRTESGMLMPYEEAVSSTSEGIFGRVFETVNTARDIAHVIWNVGWRK
ncbi:hypothetical protein SODALDRAFT_358159 [Sodiomyces alkalinus F11]|uniref:Nitrogen regulatory protein areA GATA-like domain-containing protein n=1 Tax=Sodiomyces alkalinus (strain CBS 110278 / VKM F-3762 / F11) TaxID=1314773 RepID=A0A3N2PZ25_SODAK|nr:hypothetical protein SODALDRAFT_358159 [Sodiomyces alkalinus F11]ROT39742.1 hypothetical protein SODALDRAFT_358159 [Sodiomyces alkalinus F11]